MSKIENKIKKNITKEKEIKEKLEKKENYSKKQFINLLKIIIAILLTVLVVCFIAKFANGDFKKDEEESVDYTNIVNQIYTFPLEIELQPFSYSIEEFTEQFNSGENISFNIEDATADIFPHIKVEGSGQINLTINNETMILNIEDYIELDCELLIAHKNYEAADDRVKGNFFKLLPGENIISILGNYTNLEIVYRKAYL